MLALEIKGEFKTLSSFQVEQKSLLLWTRRASSDGVRSRWNPDVEVFFWRQTILSKHHF